MSPTRWFTRLSVQVTAVITVATAIGAGLSLWFVLRAQSRLLTEQTIGQAAFFSDTLLHSLDRHMLSNERSELSAALGQVASQPRMTGLRLFDATGRTAFSKHPKEIGRVADLNEPTCLACHHAGPSHQVLDAAARSRILTGPAGRVLTTVTPVYNRTTCSSAECHAHPASQRVLGVLEVSVSLSQIDATGWALQRTTALISLLAIAGLAVTTIAFTRHQLVTPIARLAEGVDRLKQGEFRERVATQGSGEIADLSRAFNEMSGVLWEARRQRLLLLESLEQQVQDRTAALERAQAQLMQTEKLSSLGRLSASIAHEINNPLAGILTYAKLLIKLLEKEDGGGVAREKMLDRLRLIERETHRCTVIVRGLLDFARERPLSLHAVDVTAAVNEALLLVRNQFGLQNITIDAETAAVPLVDADIGQLRQALLNVLINACEAMPGGGTLTVRTRPSGAGGIVVTVTDTGVGIAADDLRRVLDPFFTTKEMGTGLGLSVVYGIVERHGGTLHIDSTVGVGTTVTLTLPASQKPPTETECPSGSPGSVKTPSPTA
jgi:two-component system NtrC family sensor kinase